MPQGGARSRARRIARVGRGAASGTVEAEGISVIAPFVSPFRRLREELKQKHRVTEIYVHTTAIRGREKYHAKSYEPPLSNFLDIDTTSATVDDCVAKILTSAGK